MAHDISQWGVSPMNFVTYTSRIVCFAIGAALAGVGMFASYVAAAKVGNEYLMVAAPLVAFAAPVAAILIEIATYSRQFFKALVLGVVFTLTAATVFYTATERNHDGRAIGEAQRQAARTTANRAERDLAAAKAARTEATVKADKARGKDTPRAIAILDSEKEARRQVVLAEQAVRDASAHAVTDSDIQQADWLMPVTVDVAGTVFFWLAFGLGKVERRPVAPAVVPVTQPVRKSVDPVKSERSRRAAATVRARKEEEAKQAAIVAGKVTAIR
jgi:hypothetical protein